MQEILVYMTNKRIYFSQQFCSCYVYLQGKHMQLQTPTTPTLTGDNNSDSNRSQQYRL